MNTNDLISSASGEVPGVNLDHKNLCMHFISCLYSFPSCFTILHSLPVPLSTTAIFHILYFKWYLVVEFHSSCLLLFLHGIPSISGLSFMRDFVWRALGTQFILSKTGLTVSESS